MKKKTVVIAISAVVCAYAITKLVSEKNKYTEEELEKIEEYKKYLEDKNYVIVEKNKYNKDNSFGLNLLSASMLPTYYKIGKVVANLVV